MAVHTHGECGARWTGLRTSHCGACHRTFGSDSGAEKHRKGKPGIDRHCVDPATVGLVPRETAYGTVWRYPSPVATAPHWETR